MSSEVRQVSREKLGSLQGCLVDGDPEQRRRERHVRRRSLVISIAMQGVVLAAVVLIPLLGKPARIALANVVPLPPYYSHAARSAPNTPAPEHAHPQNVCRFCAPHSIPPTVVIHDSPGEGNRIEEIPGIGDGPVTQGVIPIVDGRDRTPVPPQQIEVEKPHVVHMTHIDPAMLTRRIEPIYPTLPRQLGRSGRVELRAIIATDGTIQSLQVVGGDPLFFQSALEAVRQWRYTPTVLNGRIVEVDTYITVIYNIQR